MWLSKPSREWANEKAPPKKPPATQTDGNPKKLAKEQAKLNAKPKGKHK